MKKGQSYYWSVLWIYFQSIWPTTGTCLGWTEWHGAFDVNSYDTNQIIPSLSLIFYKFTRNNHIKAKLHKCFILFVGSRDIQTSNGFEKKNRYDENYQTPRILLNHLHIDSAQKYQACFTFDDQPWVVCFKKFNWSKSNSLLSLVGQMISIFLRHFWYEQMEL